jgi:hypothetical protein
MNDKEARQFLASCLPEKILSYPWEHEGEPEIESFWKPIDKNHFGQKILDTEWLHVCWLVEQGLDEAARMPWLKFNVELWKIVCPENKPDGLTEIAYGSPLHIWRATHATWQQRTAALKAVKGKD